MLHGLHRLTYLKGAGCSDLFIIVNDVSLAIAELSFFLFGYSRSNLFFTLAIACDKDALKGASIERIRVLLIK